MRTEEKTFMGVSPETGNFAEVVIDDMLTSLSLEERMGKIIDSILLLAKSHNDQGVLKFLQLLENLYEILAENETERARVAKEITWEEVRKREHVLEISFIETLKNLYREFPDKNQPSLSKSQKYILEKVMSVWYPDDHTDYHVQNFHFLIAAYIPIVEPLFRDRIGHYYKAKDLEPWLLQPVLPKEIAKILAIARIRNSGLELTMRDMRFAKLLEPLDPENRSDAALELHKSICEKIRILDSHVKELIEEMQPKSAYLRWNYEKIGESEYVAGKIKIDFGGINDLLITVSLPEDCGEALGKDIAGRARRQIESWRTGLGEELNKLSIALKVIGGRDNLHYIHAFYANENK